LDNQFINRHAELFRCAALHSRAGTRRLYRANRRAVTQLRADLGAFWDANLSRLKIAAEVAERKKNDR
jgi:hypothetical protein